MKINRELILILAFFFFVVAVVGWDFNETAVHSNNCMMPVLNESANYYHFTDIFTINGWVYSLGDFMIYIGATLFIIFFIWYLIKLILDYKEVRRNENRRF